MNPFCKSKNTFTKPINKFHIKLYFLLSYFWYGGINHLSAINVGGQGFLNYYYDMDKEFADLRMWKTYVDIKSDILEMGDYRVKFRYTLDMNFTTNILFTKFAYLEVMRDNVHFFFGQHITPYTPYMMKNFWKYLFIDYMSHHRYKITITSDRGFSVWYKHPVFNAHVGVYYGEGFMAHEVSRGKDLMGRVTYFLPLENVKVDLHGHFQVGSARYVIDSAEVDTLRQLFYGTLSLNFRGFTFFTEYFTGRNVGLSSRYYGQADIFSAFTFVPVMNNCLVLRCDMYGSSGFRTKT